MFVYLAVKELFQRHLTLLEDHLYENVESYNDADARDSQQLSSADNSQETTEGDLYEDVALPFPAKRMYEDVALPFPAKRMYEDVALPFPAKRMCGMVLRYCMEKIHTVCM